MNLVEFLRNCLYSATVEHGFVSSIQVTLCIYSIVALLLLHQKLISPPLIIGAWFILSISLIIIRRVFIHFQLARQRRRYLQLVAFQMLMDLQQEETMEDQQEDSEEVISRLAQIQAVKSSDCCICLDKIEKDQTATLLVCSHLFHPTCIQGWLKFKMTCPVCKTSVLGN